MTAFPQPAAVDLPVSFTANGDLGSTTRKHLVIGSLTTAQDQGYQNLVKDLERTSGQASVERQLWDRIVAGAAVLAPSSYASAHILLALVDLKEFDLLDLFGPVGDGLVDGAVVEISGGIEELVLMTNALAKAGLGSVRVDGTKVIAQKTTPSAANGVSRPLGDASLVGASSAAANQHGSVSLKLRRPDNSSAKKASLWALTSAPVNGNDGLIDDDTLLTAEDLARPRVITRLECDVKKTRRACKNCTCGLRELELAEADDLPASRKAAVNGTVSAESRVGNSGVKKQIVTVGNVTSSCGNCYLGDAFRCSGCPYLGLPAFEPGQKVVLTDDMGDDI